MAIKDNYCNFSGRSSRSEYWWFYLFTFLLGIVINILSFSLGEFMTVVGWIVDIALLLPSLGLAVRRLHDTDRSGWWLLIGLIPIVGIIILIVFFCQDSQMYPNEYGPVPNLVN